MELDTRTLMVATALVAALLGVVAVYAALRSGEARPAMRLFAGALLLAAAGIAAVALRKFLPGLVSIALANTAIVASVVVSYRGLNRFLGRPTEDAQGWTAVAATFAALVWLSEFEPSLAGRIAFVSLVMAILLARNAWLLHRHALEWCRAPLGVAKAVFVVAAAVMLARGIAEPVMIVSGGAEQAADFFAPNARRAYMYLVFIVLIAALAAAAFWMEMETTQAALVRLATTDAVTGLPNRTLFLDRLTQALAQARRNQAHAGVMFIDLDRFKEVNDAHGHAYGDALLRAIGDRLRGAVRRGDTVARIGGDEMGIVLAPIGRREDAEAVARKLSAALAEPYRLEGRETRMTASIGVALFPEDGDDAEGLLRNADAAMYGAKRTGRNTFQFYRPTPAA